MSLQSHLWDSLPIEPKQGLDLEPVIDDAISANGYDFESIVRDYLNEDASLEVTMRVFTECLQHCKYYVDAWIEAQNDRSRGFSE